MWNEEICRKCILEDGELPEGTLALMDMLDKNQYLTSDGTMVCRLYSFPWIKEHGVPLDCPYQLEHLVMTDEIE